MTPWSHNLHKHLPPLSPSCEILLLQPTIRHHRRRSRTQGQTGALACQAGHIINNVICRALAEALVRSCGKSGPVFAYYTPFEKRVVRELVQQFLDLDTPLTAIVNRIEDILPITRNNYYHSCQHGSWSIKAKIHQQLDQYC
ncbi:DUF2779 domain-containing protein [Verrucomicrobiaceae bacterium R5-34]|nr:DUF2779 domain-containing protein [Verrucomicrobiaceae bacterium R5-34]